MMRLKDINYALAKLAFMRCLLSCVPSIALDSRQIRLRAAGRSKGYCMSAADPGKGRNGFCQTTVPTVAPIPAATRPLLG
jgi:hypothetical protein